MNQEIDADLFDDVITKIKFMPLSRVQMYEQLLRVRTPSAEIRPLREGEVIGAYMDFDRTADKAWTDAEYLTKFGLFISERTVVDRS